MAAQLKIEVANKGYNPGYKKVCEWIDFVAEDAKATLEGIAILCTQDVHYGLSEGGNLLETLIAMEYYFENEYEGLCDIYPEYNYMPRVDAEEEVTISAHGRPVRDRRRSEFS